MKRMFGLKKRATPLSATVARPPSRRPCFGPGSDSYVRQRVPYYAPRGITQFFTMYVGFVTQGEPKRRAQVGQMICMVYSHVMI